MKITLGQHRLEKINSPILESANLHSEAFKIWSL